MLIVQYKKYPSTQHPRSKTGITPARLIYVLKSLADNGAIIMKA